MTREQEREICQAAVERFGRLTQILKAMEEMGELTRALCRHLSDVTRRDRLVNVWEEMADVSIMLDQLKLIFDAERVEAWRADKLARLAAKVRTEKGGEHNGV